MSLNRRLILILMLQPSSLAHKPLMFKPGVLMFMFIWTLWSCLLHISLYCVASEHRVFNRWQTIPWPVVSVQCPGEKRNIVMFDGTGDLMGITLNIARIEQFGVEPCVLKDYRFSFLLHATKTEDNRRELFLSFWYRLSKRKKSGIDLRDGKINEQITVTVNTPLFSCTQLAQWRP